MNSLAVSGERSTVGCILFIPKRIALAKEYIALYVHPEKDEKINDNWGAKREKGEIDKIQPDLGAGDIELFAKVAANAKSLQFYKAPKVFQFFHKGNLRSDH